MKKIVYVIIALFIFNTANAQKKGQMIKWLHIAPKAGVGTSLLINSNSFQDKSIEPSFFNLSTHFGGSFGISIGDYLGFYVEGNMMNFSQNYHMQVEYLDGTDNSYDKTLDFKASNVGVLMRWVSDMGGYFEMGPSFTTMKKVTVTNSVDLSQVNPTTEDFNDSYINLSLGFGQAVYRNERLSVFIGARLNYSPVSMFLPRDVYPENSYFKDGAYASAVNQGWTGDNQPNSLYNPDKHSIQGKTMPLTGFLNFEVNYIFGFWGNARCGRGRLMFFQ